MVGGTKGTINSWEYTTVSGEYESNANVITLGWDITPDEEDA